jgi:uncharacterized OB-fold protein
VELSAVAAVGTLQRPRFDLARGVLVGTRCGACGTPSWPARAVCFRCGSGDAEDTAFAPTGTLTTYTVVWVSRPGLEAPYSLGQVVLDGGVSLYAHVRSLEDSARVPLRVRLVLDEQPDAFPAFWFVPGEVERE